MNARWDRPPHSPRILVRLRGPFGRADFERARWEQGIKSQLLIEARESPSLIPSSCSNVKGTFLSVVAKAVSLR